MVKTVAEKMGIKDGYKTYFKNAPLDVLEAIDLPSIAIAKRLQGIFNYIHLFVITAQDFNKHFSQLKGHLADTGMLWVS